MRKILISLLLVFTFGSFVHAFSWEHTMKRVYPRVLKMEGTDWNKETHPRPDFCTATLIAPGRAVLALHCIVEALPASKNRDAYELYVGGREAILLGYQYITEDDGLALLGFLPDATDKYFPVRRKPLKMGEQIGMFGFGYEMPKMPQFGYVSLPAEPDHGMVIIDGSILPGDSGGPVFDRDGRLVGISDAVYSRADFPQAHFGMAFNGEQIYQFLHSHEIL
jgi:hypothetical protein